ncbi:hypothetical protein BGZ54_006701 [Gamsiella multidivaricata]|nr:hypothetical protein BGZ54_006701 [Gamsiella multidivaricata]
MVGRSAGIVDVSDQAGWRFSESPSAYTPMSLRPTNSQSSLGSASALGSTPTTASAAVMTQTVSMNKTDYLNYKPIPPSRDQFMQWQRQSGTYSAQTSTGPVSNASTAVKDVREYLSMEQLALCESQPLMAIENELGPSDTFTSIPSSASAATTAAAADGWHAEDMDTLSTGVINSCSDGMSMDTSKVVKRAVSAESFLGRAGKFARMASLHPRVVGLEESLAILQRPVLSDEFVRSRGSDFELGKVVEGPVSLVISVEEKQISDSTGEDVEAGEIGRCKD